MRQEVSSLPSEVDRVEGQGKVRRGWHLCTWLGPGSVFLLWEQGRRSFHTHSSWMD